MQGPFGFNINEKTVFTPFVTRDVFFEVANGYFFAFKLGFAP